MGTDHHGFRGELPVRAARSAAVILLWILTGDCASDSQQLWMPKLWREGDRQRHLSDRCPHSRPALHRLHQRRHTGSLAASDAITRQARHLQRRWSLHKVVKRQLRNWSPSAWLTRRLRNQLGQVERWTSWWMLCALTEIALLSPRNACYSLRHRRLHRSILAWASGSLSPMSTPA